MGFLSWVQNESNFQGSSALSKQLKNIYKGQNKGGKQRWSLKINISKSQLWEEMGKWTLKVI